MRLFEWLDDADDAAGDHRPAAIRRVLATVIESARTLRLSGPDPTLVERAVREVVRLAPGRVESIRREATPLPLAFLDAAVWSIRLPVGIDLDGADASNRAAVEHYYETAWINRPRQGLDGHSPVAAGSLASGGDLVMLAKLTAVVRVREQLGARPSTAQLYQGYPFDRVRRRLGLPLANPEAVDPLDPAIMSARDLDALDPKTLDPFALVDAFESVAALGDDNRTARFAAILAEVDPATAGDSLRRVDLAAVFATLIRAALVEDDVDLATEWTNRAVVVDAAIHHGRDASKFATWRAEILARAGRPDAALVVYRQILATHPDAATALDAAETLLDNGHDDDGQTLARTGPRTRPPGRRFRARRPRRGVALMPHPGPDGIRFWFVRPPIFDGLRMDSGVAASRAGTVWLRFVSRGKLRLASFRRAGR